MKWLKKFRDSRMIIGGVCIAVAAALAFVALPRIYNKKASTVKICRLAADIPAGTRIDSSMITEVEVGAYGLPDAAIRNRGEIDNKYSKTAISRYDLLFSDKFVEYISDETLDRIMADGQRLITVSLGTTAAGVANHIRPGDRVTAAVYTEPDTDSAVVEIAAELRGLEVYGIENDQTRSVASSFSPSEESGDEDLIPATVTLIVNEDQAKKLIRAEYTGKIHIIFESRGGTQ